jgi:hypothetical protein
MERITFKRETSIDDLMERVFETKRMDAAARAAAQGTLRQANPHLDAFEQLPPDVPLVVPSGAEVDAPRTLHPFEATLKDLTAQVQTALGDLRGALDEAAARQVEEARAGLAWLQSRDFKAIAAQDPARAEILAADIKARAEQAKVLETFQAQALTQLEQDLPEFGNVLTRLATQTISQSPVVVPPQTEAKMMDETPEGAPLKKTKPQRAKSRQPRQSRAK